MPNYLNAILMLTLTLGVFLALAKLLQAMRSGRLVLPWQAGRATRTPVAAARMVVEHSCMIDGKRRLLLVRCDELRIVLLTGGPADLVVSVLPASVTVA
jgi:hypothetical protein